MSDLEALHPEAALVSAFRILKNGGCRAYSVIEFVRGRAGIERTVRIAEKVGYVETYIEGAPSYALLDILDADCSELQEYNIPTADAFKWWKRTLGLRVESEDPPHSYPTRTT